jgi:hypothetical protein
LQAGENSGRSKGGNRDGYQDEDGHLLEPGIRDGFEAGLSQDQQVMKGWHEPE